MRGKVVFMFAVVSVLILSIPACKTEPTVITEVVVVTATPGPVKALTFGEMVDAAMASMEVISAEEAKRRIDEVPNTLVIDPRDAADIPYTGMIPGALNVSYGSLTYMADNEVPMEWRELELQDRSRPIITACTSGELGALAAKMKPPVCLIMP